MKIDPTIWKVNSTAPFGLTEKHTKVQCTQDKIAVLYVKKKSSWSQVIANLKHFHIDKYTFQWESSCSAEESKLNSLTSEW